MDRRTFVAVVGSSLLAIPCIARAQVSAKIHRIGLLESGPSPAADPFGQWGAFREGLRTLGYVEGKSLAIESRSADDKYERLPDLAVELIGLNVEVIVLRTTPAAVAARRVAPTLPIVILSAIDPVGAGLVASLAKPGGTITGLTTLAPDLSAKTRSTAQGSAAAAIALGRSLEFRQPREHGRVETDGGGGPNAGSPAPIPTGGRREGFRACLWADR